MVTQAVGNMEKNIHEYHVVKYIAFVVSLRDGPKVD